MAATPDELRSGQQILHYRLVEKLGEGGMGVVWKATDSSLDRAVALKALPPAFSADSERLARFEREARLLASLNHPNIATVYSVHQVEGVRYLSMELVPGEDLAQRLARGPVPVAEALELARQVALALEAAHESGVVHRDLKPANIRVTPDGRVKVLDFGLAKALDPDTRSVSLSASPTHALSAMTGGMIIGTAAYMSPEQARGQAADRRADIWSFGVVLYEMLSGARAFDGETVSDTLAAVLRAEPDRALLPLGVPARVRALLDRCLEKSPRRRLRDIGEAVLVLEDVIAGGGSELDPAPAAPAATKPGARAWWPLTVAAIALVAAAVGWLRPGTGSLPLRKHTLSLQAGRELVQGPRLSPDGGKLAYLLGEALWIRDFSQLESRKLVGRVDADFFPVWSPDGEAIAFAQGSGLARVGISSGAVTPICPISLFTGGSGGIWTRDGRILFTHGSDHLYQVAQAGGVPTVLAARIESTEVDLHHAAELPRKDAFVCVLHLVNSGPSVLAVVQPGGKRHVLIELKGGGGLSNPVYDRRGYLLFGRTGEGGGVWALPFSADRLRATGEPFLVAPGAAAPSISADGTISYRQGGGDAAAQVITLDRDGVVRDTLGPVTPGAWSLRLSPDGRTLAVEVREGSEGDIWAFDLVRRTQARLAYGPGRQLEPAWSPDGRTIAFRDLNSSFIQLAPADGSRPPRAVVAGLNPQFTPDGRYLAYSRRDPRDNQFDLVLAPLVAGADTVVLQGPALENYASPAPHAPFVAYDSDESGSLEVYLRSYPGGEGRWQVSTNGGDRPLWSPAGDRLYYFHERKFYEVDVQLAPSVRLGTPRLLYDMDALRIRGFARHTIVPTRDPSRFYAIRDTDREDDSGNDAVIVQNWPAEFAKRK